MAPYRKTGSRVGGHGHHATHYRHCGDRASGKQIVTMREQAPGPGPQEGAPITRPRMSSNARIDRGTPIPLYFQIAEQLRDEMRRRSLRPGTLLTTDERVQQDFGVSRATARKAIDELVDEGLVERVTGRGTFTIEPRLQVPLPAMLSFTEELERRGMRPRTHIISVGWVPAGERAVHALGVPARARVLQLERIRHANDTPVLHTVDILPGNLGIGPD